MIIAPKFSFKFNSCRYHRGVIGLGAIGSRVVSAALSLGMNVVGYDPVLSLDAALQLPGDRMKRVMELDELFEVGPGGLTDFGQLYRMMITLATS